MSDKLQIPKKRGSGAWPGLAVGLEKAPRAYFGPELRPHFLLSELGLEGSALGAFIGPCHVKTEHLVDWEDRLQSDFIAAERMIHFLGEFFGASLREGVLAQRLLVAMVQDSLNQVSAKKGRPLGLVRSGDDIFWGDRKLSVSIVTASPVSQLLHLGLNWDPAGAPVKAVGLAEWKLFENERELSDWILGLLESFSKEWAEIDRACTKVRSVL